MKKDNSVSSKLRSEKDYNKERKKENQRELNKQGYIMLNLKFKILGGGNCLPSQCINQTDMQPSRKCSKKTREFSINNNSENQNFAQVLQENQPYNQKVISQKEIVEQNILILKKKLEIEKKSKQKEMLKLSKLQFIKEEQIAIQNLKDMWAVPSLSPQKEETTKPQIDFLQRNQVKEVLIKVGFEEDLIVESMKQYNNDEELVKAVVMKQLKAQGSNSATQSQVLIPLILKKIKENSEIRSSISTKQSFSSEDNSNIDTANNPIQISKLMKSSEVDIAPLVQKFTQDKQLLTMKASQIKQCIYNIIKATELNTQFGNKIALVKLIFILVLLLKYNQEDLSKNLEQKINSLHRLQGNTYQEVQFQFYLSLIDLILQQQIKQAFCIMMIKSLGIAIDKDININRFTQDFIQNEQPTQFEFISYIYALLAANQQEIPEILESRINQEMIALAEKETDELNFNLNFSDKIIVYAFLDMVEQLPSAQLPIQKYLVDSKS